MTTIEDRDLNLTIRGTELQIAVLGDLNADYPAVAFAAKARERILEAARAFTARDREIATSRGLTDLERAGLNVKNANQQLAKLDGASKLAEAAKTRIGELEGKLRPATDPWSSDSELSVDLALAGRVEGWSPERRAAFLGELEDGGAQIERVAIAVARTARVVSLDQAFAARVVEHLYESRNAPTLAELRDSRIAASRIARSIAEVGRAIEQTVAQDRQRAAVATA
jgi:hypothetical protein